MEVRPAARIANHISAGRAGAGGAAEQRSGAAGSGIWGRSWGAALKTENQKKAGIMEMGNTEHRTQERTSQKDRKGLLLDRIVGAAKRQRAESGEQR